MTNALTVIRSRTGRLLSTDQTTAEELAYKLAPSYRANRLEPPPSDVLNDYDKFFAYGGGVLHPKRIDPLTGLHERILTPAPYQSKFANMERAVLLGSNKLGKTHGEMINDFRTRLMPKYAGFDCLLVGQTQFMADQHLLKLKKWVLQSPTLNRFLITRPEKRFKRLPEEKSKMTQMYIENPYDPDRSSRIIAIGFSESLAYSWADINRIHVSDPGMIKRTDQTSFFSGLYSRLSNTEGQIKIEGVAGDRIGYFWELCRVLFNLDDKASEELDFMDPDRQSELELIKDGLAANFEKMMVTVDEGVKAGIVSTEWLDWIRGIISKEEYDRIYYCKFRKPTGAIFGTFQKGEHAPLNLQELNDSEDDTP